MKNILIVAGTYYPDSMATIGITQRLAEELHRKGYTTYVYPLCYNGHKDPGYPTSHNGVEILKTDDLMVSLPLHDRLQHRFAQKLHSAKKKMECIRFWGGFFEWEEKKYRKNKLEAYFKVEALKVECLIRTKEIDTVISIALPFGVHSIVSKVKRKNSAIRWIPISFDPYAYDEVTNAHQKEECIMEEIEVLQYADKIMFLTQFENDYKNNPLKGKICYFELPNIRQVEYDSLERSVAYAKDAVNCVFLGNLYRIQRHPQFLFELFHSIQNKNIRLYIVGSLVDIPQDYIDEWIQKLDGRLVYAGRVSQTASFNAMMDADILINIGHSTTNQCPSKILDYMSTGKPILNISKIDACTSLPYFEKYPRVFCLYEKNGITAEIAEKAEDFILNNAHLEPLEFDFVASLYKNSTMEEMIRKIEKN